MLLLKDTHGHVHHENYLKSVVTTIVELSLHFRLYFVADRVIYTFYIPNLSIFSLIKQCHYNVYSNHFGVVIFPLFKNKYLWESID